MKILIVPNGFKGTLSAPEAIDAIEQGLRRVRAEGLELRSFPLADGGQGSSEIVGTMLGAERIELEVCGPEASLVGGFYYLHGGNAYVELAAASGFTQSSRGSEAALRATTFGTGQLIADAIERGATDITLFLGGSATTDGGVGFARALGAKFYSDDLRPTPSATDFLEQPQAFPGECLVEIYRIDLSELRESLESITLRAIADVDNPLYGPKGAAYIYGPQKGLNVGDVEQADRGLRNLAARTAAAIGEDLSAEPGAGAAGGSGFGMCALLGGSIVSGSNFFLSLIKFDEELTEADLVITGEGAIDDQSVQGKLSGEVVARTKAASVPIVVLCGQNKLSAEVLSSNPHMRVIEMTHPDSMNHAGVALEQIAALALSPLNERQFSS